MEYVVKQEKGPSSQALHGPAGGARNWFSSTAPTSFHTRVYSLLQGRQDPGHHMTKAGTLKPVVGGASGAFPSPVSRPCCPTSSRLFPDPLFTGPKDLPSSKQAHKIKPHVIPSGLVPPALFRPIHPQTPQAPRPDPQGM